jgi:1,4-alpha-glucan branching enzyme
MTGNTFALVLHAHVPYVMGHGSWPHGEDWLYEAAAETYLPLLDVCRRLLADGVSPQISLGITPVLAEQLADSRFKSGFALYLEERAAAAREMTDASHRGGDFRFAGLGGFWTEFYQRRRAQFESLGNDILGAFKRLQDEGHIEILAGAATHGYAPLLGSDASVAAQFRLGAEIYRKYFKREPAGAWLPECAYRPAGLWQNPVFHQQPPFWRKGTESLLRAAGPQYFIADAALLDGGQIAGYSGERFETEGTPGAPAITVGKSWYSVYDVSSHAPDAGCAVFIRDPATALQVWSRQGYPGDPRYLEFHKKSYPGGLRCWSITDSHGDLGSKEAYSPQRVEEVLENQSNHFVQLVGERLRSYEIENGSGGILVAPFDAELFGHWWFEGPEWLYRVVRKMQASEIRMRTLSRYLECNPPRAKVELPEGSWGAGGAHGMWMNPQTEWVWKLIYEGESRFQDLRNRLNQSAPDHAMGLGLLAQAGRELLLLQASDWPFLISSNTARDYAEGRIKGHAADLHRILTVLEALIEGSKPTSAHELFLAELQTRDALFKDLNPNLFM